MSLTQETIDATIEADGSLRLSHPSQVVPGPVRVTIQATTPNPNRRLADVIREIAAGQRARGFAGLSQDEIRADADLQTAEADEYDRELAAARRPGNP